MKIILLITIFSTFYLDQALSAYTREKRLIRYPFPGPRADAVRDENAEAYGAASAGPLSPRVKRKPQYEELIDDYSKETYSQPAGRSNARSSSSGSPASSSAAQTYRPTVADPYAEQPYRSSQPSAYSSSSASGSPDSRYQSAGFASRSSGESYESTNQKQGKSKEEAEEEKKPSRLELLLGQSKFTCNGKKDGYYADASVACQVFHYCVGGAKHSWQCPEGTVFHQVHLNCVPASQDICDQSEKFFVVNEYLHKPIDNGGPNNSVRYHQRYYPEEFLGDPLAAAFPAGSAQSYPAKPVPVSNGGAGSSAPRAPQGSYSGSYEDDYSGEDNRQSSPYRSPQPAAQPPRPSAPRNQPNYGPYSPKPKPQGPPPPPPQQPSYTFSAKPYSGSGYGSNPSRPSYANEDGPNERSSSSSSSSSSSPYRPTPSPYSGSTRPYSGYSVGPSSPPYASPAPSSNYSPYKPVTLSSSSPNYGYSRSSPSPSSVSPSSAYNPKPNAVPPYSSYPPSYSPYSSNAYGSSAASERNVRPSSYDPRGYSATSNKPYGYSGVTYEEDY
ncbi:uncharacterized protein LOC128395380 [Panonychus citri]|uniref:uncharacterized protein LOC128395380 n=1 Tax=Panonychus citri TaxID=50023 RepID=UPI0023072CBD|nr:uncharacterized protein LOC128395380 [Panonychus citri]